MRATSPLYYQTLWQTMKFLPDLIDKVNWYAQKLLRYRERYEEVESECGVPWFVVGAIHALEAGFDFDTYLGNGDPLDAPSVNVPAGRGPFETWEAGASDALGLEKGNEPTVWDIPGIARYLEEYNGSGYYKYHNINSPYLWSFSDQYQSGKYTSDGNYDANCVSDQCGAMVIIKQLVSMGAVTLGQEATQNV
jgi:lysozyme family protein